VYHVHFTDRDVINAVQAFATELVACYQNALTCGFPEYIELEA
jgi:hypothetical protein